MAGFTDMCQRGTSERVSALFTVNPVTPTAVLVNALGITPHLYALTVDVWGVASHGG